MQPDITDQEIEDVLKYVESVLQVHCLQFFRRNGRSLQKLSNFLQRLYAIGREAHCVPNSSDYVETRFCRDLTVGDLYLIEKLSELDADMGQSAHYGTWDARSFARNCERLLERVSRIDPNLRSPADEMALLIHNFEEMEVDELMNRNLSRYSAQTREGQLVRLGILLGAKMTKHHGVERAIDVTQKGF